MPPKDNTRDIAMNALAAANNATDRVDRHEQLCTARWMDSSKKMDNVLDQLGTLDDNNKRITTIAMCGVIGFTALTKLPDLLIWLKTMLH